MVCDATEGCIAVPVIDNTECGDGGVCVTGLCCIPDCENKDCGSDGCLNLCGSCDDGQSCTEEGLCEDPPPPVDSIGCSDGTREGFLNMGAFPFLAACGGAWDVPGIHHTGPDGPEPACDRQAGNTGTNSTGSGCNVEDLCSAGWHVCLGKDDVQIRNEGGCDGIMDDAQSPAFFLARISSTGAFNCAPDTIGDPTSSNDLFGCGDLGCPATQATCAPLTLGSHDRCKSLKNKPTTNCSCSWNAEETEVSCNPNSGGCGWCKPLDYWNVFLGEDHSDVWDCGSNTTQEANNVIKLDSSQGGVLCCKDDF